MQIFKKKWVKQSQHPGGSGECIFVSLKPAWYRYRRGTFWGGRKTHCNLKKTRDNYAFKKSNKVLGNVYWGRVIVLCVWKPRFESHQSRKMTKMATRACVAPSTPQALGRSVDKQITGSCWSAHLASKLLV